MGELLNQTKRNTKFLFSIIKKQDTLLSKFEVIEQIYLNITVLKESMPAEEFEKEFGTIEDKIINLLDQLTDKKLLNELTDKIKGLITFNL